jgi:hypothetical protein
VKNQTIDFGVKIGCLVIIKLGIMLLKSLKKYEHFLCENKSNEEKLKCRKLIK